MPDWEIVPNFNPMTPAALFRERQVRWTTLPGAAVSPRSWMHCCEETAVCRFGVVLFMGAWRAVKFTNISMRQLPRTAKNVTLAFWVMSGLGLSFGEGFLSYGNMGCLSGEGSFFPGLWSRCLVRWSALLFIHRTMGPIFLNSKSAIRGTMASLDKLLTIWPPRRVPRE